MNQLPHFGSLVTYFTIARKFTILYLLLFLCQKIIQIQPLQPNSNGLKQTPVMEVDFFQSVPLLAFPMWRMFLAGVSGRCNQEYVFALLSP